MPSTTLEVGYETTPPAVSYNVAALVWQNLYLTVFSILWRRSSQLAADDPWADAAATPPQAPLALSTINSGLDMLCRLAREHLPRSVFMEVARMTHALRHDTGYVDALPPLIKTAYVLFSYGDT